MVRVIAMLCMLVSIVFVMCVALPAHVGARSIVVLLGQHFDYSTHTILVYYVFIDYTALTLET